MQKSYLVPTGRPHGDMVQLKPRIKSPFQKSSRKFSGLSIAKSCQGLHPYAILIDMYQPCLLLSQVTKTVLPTDRGVV